MSKKATEEMPTEPTQTFEILGLVKSDFMPIKIDGREIDLANVTPEVTAWLYARREKLPWLKWSE